LLPCWSSFFATFSKIINQIKSLQQLLYLKFAALCLAPVPEVIESNDDSVWKCRNTLMLSITRRIQKGRATPAKPVRSEDAKHQLQPEDRVSIASLKQQIFSVRAIARQFQRSPSAISRELQRNSGPGCQSIGYV
jgi:hypothetical protein